MFLRPLFATRAKQSTSGSKPRRGRASKRSRVLRAEVLERRALLSISPNLGILTLDTSSSGALARSSSGSIVVTNGDIVVDSASATAGVGSGTGNVSATNIYLHGGYSNTGSGKFLGTVHTGATAVADPLASLPTPSEPSTAFYGPTINSGTVTLQPGTYVGRITIENSAHVTFAPGLYYLIGGMSISGGTVAGSGVTLYDPSNSINISGSANVSLSAPTSGLYQGIVLFESRADVRPITVAASAAVNLTGEVYAPSAALQISGGSATISGNGTTIPSALIAKDLSVSGGSLTVHANSSGSNGDLSISETDNDGGSSICDTEGLATAGGSIVYTITVTNCGPSAALGALVKDTMPTGITSETFTVAATGGAVDLTHASGGSGSISDSVYMPTGSTLVYTVTANISATATGSITSSPSISAPALFTDYCTSNNTASDTDSLLKADLAITDTDSKTSVVPGTTDTYTVVVTNNGPNAVSGATVKDLLAANADIASDTFTVATTSGAADSTNSSHGSGSINDLVNLASGSKITYTITAQIKASATGTLANTATVADPSIVADPVSTNNLATDSDSLTPQVNLVVTTCDNDSGTIVPGTQVTYTVKVQNCGPSNAVGVLIADALPSGITSDTYTASGSSGASGFTASGSGSIDDTSVSLASGACITYTITANVGAADTGTLVDTATATAGSGETNTNSHESGGTTSASDTASLSPQADLVITNSDSGGGTSASGGTTGAAVPGNPLTYTVVVQDTGPSNAVGVTVADTLPAGVSSDSYTAVGTSGASGFIASGTGSIDDTSVHLAAGATITYTITANITASTTGTLSNSASATVGTGETNTNSNQVSGTTTAVDVDDLTPKVDLVVTTSDNGGGTSGGATGNVVPGENVTYTVTVHNTGPSNAVGVAVADSLPSCITSDAYTAVGSAGASGFTASGTGNIGDTVNLTAGSSITYTIVGAIKASATGTLSNSVTATAGAGETNTNAAAIAGATTATDADDLTPHVSLVVTKIASGFGTAVPGSQMMYIITVTNAGPSDAVNTTIADLFPAGVASDTYTAEGTTGASGYTANGTGNIDDTTVELTAGAGATYMVMADISSSATGTLTDTASATVGAGETNSYPLQVAGRTSATDVQNLSPQSGLVVTTTDDGGGSSSGTVGSVVPGDAVTYTITVLNAGPSDATGVAIADSLPSGITSDAYTAAGTAGSSGYTASGTGNIADTVNLAAGASITYTVVADIDPSVTGTLSNTATATIGAGQSNNNPSEVAGTTSATVTDDLSPQADLTVTATDDGGGTSGGTTGNVVPGETVTYTITVANNGSSNATGASVADSLPAGITGDTYRAVGTAGTSGYTASGSGNIADTVNLAAGASITYMVVANIDAASTGTLSNTATATIGAGQTNVDASQVGGATSATVNDSLTPQVDLLVTKTDDGGGSSDGTIGAVAAGGVVTYTITVENAGPSNAAGVAVADGLPIGIDSAMVTAVGTAGSSGYTASGSGGISDTVNLASGSSVTYTVVANIDALASSPLTNTVTATVGSGETNTNPIQVGGITSATDTDLVV